MKQDTVVINDTNAEEIIDIISSNLINGKKVESVLERMVDRLYTFGFLGEFEEYVKYRTKIIEYIQGFYV